MTMSETIVITRRLPPLPALMMRAGYRVAPLVDRYLAPLVQLGLRLWMADIFYKSGLTKIADWDATVLLFEFEYKVPLLSPGLAAELATACELVLPVLLVLGLFTRLAALPLLGMTLVIQFVLGTANEVFSNPVHYYWMLLLLTIFARGAGPLSLDSLLASYLSTGPSVRSKRVR